MIAHQHGIAIGRGLGGGVGGQIAAGAGLVLHDDTLPQRCGHGLGQGAGDEVGAAAGGEGGEDAQGPGGKSRLGQCWQRRQRGQQVSPAHYSAASAAGFPPAQTRPGTSSVPSMMRRAVRSMPAQATSSAPFIAIGTSITPPGWRI